MGSWNSHEQEGHSGDYPSHYLGTLHPDYHPSSTEGEREIGREIGRGKGYNSCC